MNSWYKGHNLTRPTKGTTNPEEVMLNSGVQIKTAEYIIQYYMETVQENDEIHNNC